MTKFAHLCVCFFAFNLSCLFPSFVASGQGPTIEQLQERASSGDAESQYQLGERYGNGKGVATDFQKAFSLFSAAAEQEHTGGQNGLAVCYLYGLGVDQDLEKAVRYFKLAASKGFARSQRLLGLMYANGIGVAKDYAESVKWYRLAADQGLAAGQYNLGVMYGKGQGVPQDDAEAYVWLFVAAAGGYADAVKDRDIIAGRLTPEQLSQGQKRATELFEKISSGK
ncbi:MAG: tetratricopeptide repeat protein [Rubripirellula sp.]